MGLNDAIASGGATTDSPPHPDRTEPESRPAVELTPTQYIDFSAAIFSHDDAPTADLRGCAQDLNRAHACLDGALRDLNVVRARVAVQIHADKERATSARDVVTGGAGNGRVSVAVWRSTWTDALGRSETYVKQLERVGAAIRGCSNEGLLGRVPADVFDCYQQDLGARLEMYFRGEPYAGHGKRADAAVEQEMSTGESAARTASCTRPSTTEETIIRWVQAVAPFKDSAGTADAVKLLRREPELIGLDAIKATLFADPRAAVESLRQGGRLLGQLSRLMTGAVEGTFPRAPGRRSRPRSPVPAPGKDRGSMLTAGMQGPSLYVRVRTAASGWLEEVEEASDSDLDPADLDSLTEAVEAVQEVLDVLRTRLNQLEEVVA